MVTDGTVSFARFLAVALTVKPGIVKFCVSPGNFLVVPFYGNDFDVVGSYECVRWDGPVVVD